MKRIHFIAIGGAAMHNLALCMAEMPGCTVSGSDDEIFEPSRSRLAAKGLLPAESGWHPERITSDLDAVILGMHATKDNPELLRAQELGIKIYSFPEFLYEQTREKQRIVIGGSHGKTTTTAMILHVMRELGVEADYMVGAQIEGFDNMVRLSPTARYAVFEGDEYLTSPIDPRPKFHLYHPHVAVLTGVAWDHINVFPTFPIYVEQFSRFTDLIEPQGTLIYCADSPELCSIAEHCRRDIRTVGYSTPEHKISNGVTYALHGGEATPLRIFGRHNLQNMTAARLVCNSIGISDEDFYRTISSFGGASNRLELVARTDDAVAYKDFAHSPSKLRATIQAVREQYPDRRLTACMELHTFSSLTEAFLPQYAGCMEGADTAFVYFNPKVIEHKRLRPITAEEVQEAFGGNVRVFTSSQDLQDELRRQDYHRAALLLMTSGNFDGVDLRTFASELINR